MSFHGRFTSLVSSRSGLFPGRAVSRLHPSGLWASPLASRLARTSGRIEFLSYGPTDSPPVALHPTFGGLNSSFPSVTQLPSAFNQSSVWLRGLSPPIQMCSRAHWPRAESAGLTRWHTANAAAKAAATNSYSVAAAFAAAFAVPPHDPRAAARGHICYGAPSRAVLAPLRCRWPPTGVGLW
jgi:hypothetical protein